MSYDAKNFYSYFRECYKLDYKEFEVDNILATKHTNKWFVSDKEDLFNGSTPIIPYFNKKIDALEKEIELYKLEKKLFYGCFFVLGKKEGAFSKDKRFCAPLFLFPATIKTIDEDKYLEIDKEAAIINRAVLTKMETKNDKLSKDRFVQEVSALLYNDSGEFIGLKRLFDQFFTNIDSEEMMLYPSVWSAHKIRKHFSETDYSEGQYKLIPAAGTVFVQKSESSLKVLNDLTQMAEQGTFNLSMEKLLSTDQRQYSFEYSYYKSRLNADQYKALQNAYRYSNSVIVGPPGTGKTYTITSIISDAVVNNQSVLVVSKTKQAVEVLRRMLQEDFKLKDYLIHTTGHNYKMSLKAKIRRYLSGITAKKYEHLNEAAINRQYNRLEKFESKFEKWVDRELNLSDLVFSEDIGLLDKWRKFYLTTTAVDGPKLWNLFEEIEEILSKLEKEVRLYSKKKIHQNIRYNSTEFRHDISLFFDALDAGSFSEYKQTLKRINQRNILKVFPIWLANLSDLNAVLPLQKDLFDLVIIDEATQCDIASALPALYRARRAVVVGDPNQLRHYSFVSGAQQNSLRKQFQLPNEKSFDYRNRSILDFFIAKVKEQDQVTFLREHFRSTPSLIEFSNQQFYEGQLEVLKSTPKHTSNKQIEVVQTKGTRNEKGINEIEAKAVIRKFDKLIKEYETTKKAPSVGILSLFNSQVTYINRLLREKYELDVLKKFNVLCGSPYNFQGSERDIMLMSCCVCDNTHHSAFVHANKPEVLNVAITRAKSYQVVFKSVSDEKLKQESLLAQYFRFIEQYTYTHQEEDELDDFQQDVYKALKKLKFDAVRCGYPYGGNLLDILVTHNDNNYFIDLIGYPGMFKEAFTFERYKTLARTGIKSLPLHYSYWQSNRADAVKKLKGFIV